MIKFCEYCHKPFETDYPSKLFCNKSCANLAADKRDESYYDFPHEPGQEPLYTFKCAYCGKEVKVYSKYDQRTRFCCGLHSKLFRNAQSKKDTAKGRPTNLGLSGGMSLGSLIRREARDLKD